MRQRERDLIGGLTNLIIDANDYTKLQKFFSVDPPPPNELADTIVGFVAAHNVVLRSFPNGIVRNILEFFVEN